MVRIWFEPNNRTHTCAVTLIHAMPWDDCVHFPNMDNWLPGDSFQWVSQIGFVSISVYLSVVQSWSEEEALN